MKTIPFRKPGIALLLQSVICFTLYLGVAALALIPWLSAIAVWILYPLASLFSAYLVTRTGVNPYLAWIMPLLMPIPAYALIWAGYLPKPGGVLFCALIGIIGSAAGDVKNKMTKSGRRG